jgi:transglycosylase-like protein with SLT domain
MHFQITPVWFRASSAGLHRWSAVLVLVALALPGIAPHVRRPQVGLASSARDDHAAALPFPEPWEGIVVEPDDPDLGQAVAETVVDVDGEPVPEPVERPRALPAMTAAFDVPAHREYLRRILVRYAQENGLPADLVMALAWKESSWRAGAVSSAGAVGVMQLMPDTVEFTSRRLLGLRRTLDPRDAVANVRMGTRFLRHLVDRNDASYRRALIAYNQGITALRTRGAYGGAARFADAVLALRSQFRAP